MNAELQRHTATRNLYQQVQSMCPLALNCHLWEKKTPYFQGQGSPKSYMWKTWSPFQVISGQSACTQSVPATSV
eukprot:1161269-Pelagomonas_calceolata.AAC.10